MPQDPETGKFTKAKPALVHPALRKKAPEKRVNAKLRRTTVRTVKLIAPGSDDAGNVVVTQLPIEPSFNNGGNLNDTTAPLRHWLEKGFQWPHEFDFERFPFVFCAIKDCWDPALVSEDPDSGTERCADHEEAWKRKEIRYAVSAKA